MKPGFRGKQAKYSMSLEKHSYQMLCCKAAEEVLSTCLIFFRLTYEVALSLMSNCYQSRTIWVSKIRTTCRSEAKLSAKLGG